jgi:hypothetical protein
MNHSYIAVQSILHHGGGYRPAGVVYFIGLSLITANPMSVIRPVARGFGASKDMFDSSGNSPAFWFGIMLVAASYFRIVDNQLRGPLPFFTYIGTALLGICGLMALASAGKTFWKATSASQKAVRLHFRASANNRKRIEDSQGELLLCGGIAQGIFRGRNLAIGAPLRNEILTYGEQSARRGTIVIGAPGSSKTRSKIYPDLYWGLASSPRAGALVFVLKRRATQDCYQIAQNFRPKNEIHVVGVGPGRATMDITARMTSESIGDAIQDGIGASSSDFWKHGPSAFVEGFVELVHSLAPATIKVPTLYTSDGAIKPGGDGYDLEIGDLLPSLLKLISLEGRKLDAVFAFGYARAQQLEFSEPRKSAALRELLDELKGRVLPLLQKDAKLGEEFRQSVLPQLQPFARGPLKETFCNRNGLDLSIIEQGHVFIVEIDETEYPRAAGTVIRLIFRRLVQMARERTAADRVRFLDPVLLIADEYGNYAAPGHAQAWNTVRESNICATIGLTSVSALVKQLGGDQNAANAIIANIANKFFFETDDKPTRDLARELVGQTIMKRHARTDGTSRTRGSSSSANSSSTGSHYSSATSQSESFSEHREEGIDSSVWMSLRAGRDHASAIAFVRTDSGILTDVVTLGVLDPSEGIETALPPAYGIHL